MAGIGSKDRETAIHESFREMEAIIEARVGRRTAELRTAYNRLESVINAARLTSIISVDLQGIITVFNSGAERMLGYSASEMVGKETPAVFHLTSELEERARALRERFGRPVTGLDIFVGLTREGEYEEREWTYVRKDGGRLIVSIVVTAVQDAKGKITGYLGIAQDITQRREAESKLLLLTERLSLATDVAALGVWEWDVANNGMTWDATMGQIYGFALDTTDPYKQWSNAHR